MRMFVWLSVEWFHKSIHEGLAKFLRCHPLQIDHVDVQAPNTWVKIKHAELHLICAPPSFSLRPASSSPLPLQKQRMRNALIESPGHSQISIETLQQSLMLGYLKYRIPRSITSWAHSHHPFRPVVPFPKTSANPVKSQPQLTSKKKKKTPLKVGCNFHSTFIVDISLHPFRPSPSPWPLSLQVPSI